MMTKQDLEPLVLESLNRLFARDAILLKTGASEWSIAHRLAVYLEQLLPGWNIDCEYNRQGQNGAPKTDSTNGLLAVSCG